MKILITGGAGFIGSQLARNLSKEHQIYSLDNLSYGKISNLEHNGEKFSHFIECDVRDDSFEGYCKGMDVVIHLAGIAPLPESQIDPRNSFDNNVLGTINVLEACRKHGVQKIIFSSTSAVYENCETYPFEEESKFEKPDLVYSQSKYTCEQICNGYTKNYGMNITTLRFFNVFGPNQDHLRKQPPLMGYIVKCLLNNEEPTFYSNGEQKRDYIFVDDVCDLIKKCIYNENSKGEIFNACTGRAYSVKEIFLEFKKQLNKEIDCYFDEPKEFWHKYPSLFKGEYPLNKERVKKEVNKFSIGSYKKAETMLNWVPKISLSEGIEKCLREVKNEHF